MNRRGIGVGSVASVISSNQNSWSLGKPSYISCRKLRADPGSTENATVSPPRRVCETRDLPGLRLIRHHGGVVVALFEFFDELDDTILGVPKKETGVLQPL